MRAVLGVLVAVGVGSALWATTGQIGLAVGAGTGAGTMLIIGSAVAQQLMSLDPRQ
jgi:hypothetical protein